MKKIEEILDQKRAINEVIQDLKKKTISVPSWDTLEKEYEPKLHKIMDKGTYLDKPIKDEKGNIIRYEPVTRVAIGLQKLAAKRMSEFMFNIPVTSVLEDETQTQKEIFKAVKKVLKKNKWNSLNKVRCRTVSSQCECATLWYPVESQNKSYGFESKFKIRKRLLTPKDGYKLYPLFDETNDLVAFSYEYSIEASTGAIEMFETWTANHHIIFKKEKGKEWEQHSMVENAIKKIPIVYTFRPEPIWADADNGKVNEIELLLSRNGDIIAYHASPVLVVKGKLQGAPSKGESNRVFFTDGSGGAEYVSWSQSPESVKFQFESLLRMFFTELQLPDISFDNIKGLGAQSGESRKWLLVDAHLKVGDESEIYEDAIERDYSIIKSYLSMMNVKWKNEIESMEITPEIHPFIIEDEKTRVDVLVSANGNKPLISQKLSAKLAGLSENPEEDYLQIKAEWAESSIADVFEPTE